MIYIGRADLALKLVTRGNDCIARVAPMSTYVDDFTWIVEILRDCVKTAYFLKWSHALLFYCAKGVAKDYMLEQCDRLNQSVLAVLSVLERCAVSKFTLNEYFGEHDNVVDVKRQRDFMKRLRQATQIKADELAQILKNSAVLAGKRDPWGCVRCSHVNHHNNIICTKSSCRACRLHGDFDCVNRICKTSFEHIQHLL